MGSSQLKGCAVLILLVCLGVYTCAHKVSEHRAEYPGRVTFAGQPRKIFGSTYYRVFWRQGSSRSTRMPDVTLHVNGQKYKLSELTPEFMKELTGPKYGGRLVDAEGNIFSSRFKEGRLNWFSLSSAGSPKGPDERSAESVSLSIGGGKPITVPITDRELRRRAGRPVSTYLTSGQ